MFSLQASRAECDVEKGKGQKTFKVWYTTNSRLHKGLTMQKHGGL